MGVVNLRGNIIRAFLIVSLIVSTIGVAGVSIASPEPVIRVEPNFNTAWVGETFTVDITITNVVNLYSWEFRMSFNDHRMDTWTGDGVKKSFVTSEKPVAVDSEEVYVNRTRFLKPARYTIDYNTGAITFTVAPGLGVEIKVIYLIPSLIPPILEVVNVTEGPFLKSAGDTSWSMMPPYIDNYRGTVKASDVLWLYPDQGATGNGVLCSITFKVKDVERAHGGKTTLHFLDALLFTYDGSMLVLIEPHTAEDGLFTNVHDIAVVDVKPSNTSVLLDDSVNISVTVANEGDFPETFDVTTQWNIGALHDVIGTQSVTNLDDGTSTTLPFTWDTTGICTGTYTISAEASVVAREIDTADNTFIYGEVTVFHPDAPEADFTPSSWKPMINETVTFNASASSDPNGWIVSWDWDFNDGNVGSGEVVSHAYTEAGIYNVTLTVEDNDGLRNIVWKPVKVLNPPVASFTYSSKPEAPLELTFVSTSTPDGGSIVDYSWDFGDDTTGTGANVTHTYAGAGNYKVTLNVTDSEGLTDSTTQIVTIQEKHDVAVVSVKIPERQKSVWVGESVSITINVRNEGTGTETFNVTTYYDDHIIKNQTVTNLKSGRSQELTVPWYTTNVPAGEYVITAEAILAGDENPTNDKNATTTISVNVADVAITSVTASPTTVLAGDLLNITIVVRNEGTSDVGSFLVEIYSSNATHRNMKIVDITIPGLTSGREKTVSRNWNATEYRFYWDTIESRISPGTYTLSAKASAVEGESEIDTDDNVFPRGDIPPINVTVGASLISISANPATTTVGSKTIIHGTIAPVRPSVNVTIHYRLVGNETWNTLETLPTNENSTYSYKWKPQTEGTYEVKASWEGDNNTLPSESETVTIKVNPAPNVFLYVVAAVGIIVMAATAIYLLRVRKLKPT